MSQSDKTIVLHGTATPGGGFPVYGDAFAATLNEIDPTLEVTPTNTKGSTENVPLLEAGKLDLGQVTGEVLYEAISGIGRAKADVRILNAMYSNSGMFIVRADSPYKTIADLKGQPIAWGAAGSGFIVLARYVMDGLGLDMHKDFVPHLLQKAGDGPAMVLDGRAAAVWGGGVGWPGFTAVSSGPSGARFIGPSPDEIKRITTLPDDTAYRLARALHKGEAALGKRLEQARESTLANTLAAAPRVELIHAGVQKYMRELGLLE